MSRKLSCHKTRIAPTPSGYLHLGNVLSFAITATLAQETGAKIFLRIDDVDRERTNKLYVQDIFDTLHFLEIPWHEGPKNMQEYEREYSQIHRMGMYHKALEQLREQGSVFACSCSRSLVNVQGAYSGTCSHKHIPYDAPDTCWRLHTDNAKLLDIKTWQGSVMHTPLPPDMYNFIVRRRDRYPAYQLTSLIDDVHFGIDFIVRGQDLLSSTLAQLYLASALGLDVFHETVFCHHALIMGADGLKLSKSAGATSVQHLRKEGKKPAYIYSLIAGMCGVSAKIISYADLVSAIGMNLIQVKQ